MYESVGRYSLKNEPTPPRVLVEEIKHAAQWCKRECYRWPQMVEMFCLLIKEDCTLLLEELDEE